MIRPGIDMVDVMKFKNVFRRHPDFARDVFSGAELAYCSAFRNPYPHLAGRFAAKEACLKALGLGISGPGIDRALGCVEVPPGQGKQALTLKGRLLRISAARGIGRMTVSLSHTRRYAIAAVILE